MSERIKRPEPDRTGPVRNWSTVFGPRERFTPPGAPPGRGGPAGDPVSRGVEAGYRVIDEYLRQGQAAARAIWSPFLPGAQDPRGEPPREGAHYNPWTGTGAPFRGPTQVPEEMQQRMGSMLRVATDLAMMWMDFLGAGPPGGARVDPAQGTSAAPRPPVAGPFTAGMEPGAPVPTPAPVAPSSPTPARAPLTEERTLITLEIQSSRRVEVSVDLRPRSSALALIAHDLRAAKGDARIEGVGIEGRPDRDQVIVRLRVPADLPPGLYTGAVLDEASALLCGSLAVRVHAE